jgi:uncharacterized protein YwbE
MLDASRLQGGQKCFGTTAGVTLRAAQHDGSVPRSVVADITVASRPTFACAADEIELRRVVTGKSYARGVVLQLTPSSTHPAERAQACVPLHTPAAGTDLWAGEHCRMVPHHALACGGGMLLRRE